MTVTFELALKLLKATTWSLGIVALYYEPV
jgi:hypothetical protein